MRTGVSILLLVFALGLQSRALCQTTGVENKILAVVNDDVVTETDLDEALSSSIDDLKRNIRGRSLRRRRKKSARNS